jgi:hypothetical protein
VTFTLTDEVVSLELLCHPPLATSSFREEAGEETRKKRVMEGGYEGKEEKTGGGEKGRGEKKNKSPLDSVKETTWLLSSLVPNHFSSWASDLQWRQPAWPPDPPGGQ